MPAFVSLFCAINVGKRQVAMADLRKMHEDLGFAGVSSVLQTGSVIFDADGEPDALEKKIEKAFAETFGFDSQVMVRSAEQMQDIVKRNPFADDEDRAKNWIVVHFLEKPVPEASQKALTEGYEGPEEIVFSESELFIYYAQGIGRSKLTPALGKHVKVGNTARNWNTITKILERMA